MTEDDDETEASDVEVIYETDAPPRVQVALTVLVSTDPTFPPRVRKAAEDHLVRYLIGEIDG